MSKDNKPTAAFEIYLKGGEVRPEFISVAILAQILSAVQRLSSGQSGILSSDKDQDSASDLRLLGVKRGSTTLPVYAPAQDIAIDQLRHAGLMLRNPESIGDNDYMLNCIKELSAASRILGCPIIIRKPGTRGEVLTSVDASTYAEMSRSIFVKGMTSIAGIVQRVGNVTGARCGLSVPFQDRMIYCKVPDVDVARKLGQLLYERVLVHGEATWLKGSFKIIDFSILSVTQPIKGSLQDAINALRNAGGDGWDDIDDPVSFIHEVTG